MNVFNSEKLRTAKESLKYLCCLLIISLLIYELVLLIKIQNIDNGNSINNVSIIEEKNKTNCLSFYSNTKFN